MADQINNPNDPQNPQGPQGPGAQGPGRTNQGNVDQMRSAIDALTKGAPALKDIATILNKLAETVERTEKAGDSLTKKYKDWGNELRQILVFSDDIEDSVKQITEYQKKMVREGIKAKDYKEVVAILKEMEKHNEIIVNKGVLSKQAGQLFERQVDGIRKAIKRLGTEMASTFNPDLVDEVMTPLVRMNKPILEVTKNLKGVRMTGLEQDIEGARKSLQHLFRMKDNTEKYRVFAKTGTEILKARKDREAGRKDLFAARRAKIEASLPKMGVDTEKFRRADGSLDRHAFRRHRDQMRVNAAKTNGLGLFGSAIYNRSTASEAMGQRPGVMTRAGMDLLARGEGSIGRGVASYGASMLEGGAAGIAEIAGRFAPALAAVEMINSLFNKNQKMNSDVFNKLGTGGVLYGQPNSIDAIRNVRSNLNGPLYSPLGIGYEKNLAIASAINEAGLSTKNLAETNLGQNGQGFVNGSFGSFQRNVYMYGKAAGLSPDKTMEETLKLVTQYRQSLTATEGFFVTINKDVRTAGLTTTKYLQLIDDVNSHYERSNKLLEETVNTMRLLSVTGRNTADDLKEGMMMITNGGQQRSTPVSTYLNAGILQDPQAARRYAEEREGALQSAAENIAKEFGTTTDHGFVAGKTSTGAAMNVDTILNLIKQGNIDQLRYEATHQFGSDTARRQSASQAIEAAQTALLQKQSFEAAMKQGNPMAGALQMTASQGMLGADITSQRYQAYMSAKKALHFSGLNDKDLANGNAFHNFKFMSIMKDAFQDHPELLKQLPNYRFEVSEAMSKVAQQGKGGPKFLENLYDELQKGGAQGLGPAANKGQSVQDSAKNHEAEMAHLLSHSSSSFIDTYLGNQAVQKALAEKNTGEAEEKARQATSATRGTAEIFATAFEYLFNKIQTPLDFIAKAIDGIGKRFFYSGPERAGAGSLGRIDQQVGNGKADLALKSYDAEIEDLQKRAAASPEDKKLKSDLDWTKKKRDEISRVVATSKDSVQRGELLQSDVSDVSKYIDEANLSRVPRLSDTATDQLFKSMNISDFKPGTSHAVSNDDWMKFGAQLQLLDKAKYKVTDQKDAQGGDHYTITNVYNSVGYTQEDGATKTAMNKAGETAASKKGKQ
jgi:hypothetical protein